jgi:hypothetical protein
MQHLSLSSKLFGSVIQVLLIPLLFFFPLVCAVGFLFPLFPFSSPSKKERRKTVELCLRESIKNEADFSIFHFYSRVSQSNPLFLWPLSLVVV